MIQYINGFIWPFRAHFGLSYDSLRRNHKGQVEYNSRGRFLGEILNGYHWGGIDRNFDEANKLLHNAAHLNNSIQILYRDEQNKIQYNLKELFSESIL